MLAPAYLVSLERCLWIFAPSYYGLFAKQVPYTLSYPAMVLICADHCCNCEIPFSPRLIPPDLCHASHPSVLGLYGFIAPFLLMP